jgi:hypothetical protein
MKKCPVIINVSFDKKSIQGIDRIKELHDLSKVGKIFLAIGHLYSIFGGSAFRNAGNSGISAVFNNKEHILIDATKATAKAISSEAGQTAYTIFQANWVYFFDSFGALDKIKRREIEKLALMQAFDHVSSPKEYAFWKAIEQGCKP